MWQWYVSCSRNTKYIGVKVASLLETCMYANRLDSYPFTSFPTLFICLQCCYNNIGGGDVSRDILLVKKVYDGSDNSYNLF